jgi:hypothetical protein
MPDPAGTLQPRDNGKRLTELLSKTRELVQIVRNDLDVGYKMPVMS